MVGKSTGTAITLYIAAYQIQQRFASEGWGFGPGSAHFTSPGKLACHSSLRSE